MPFPILVPDHRRKHITYPANRGSIVIGKISALLAFVRLHCLASPTPPAALRLNQTKASLNLFYRRLANYAVLAKHRHVIRAKLQQIT